MVSRKASPGPLNLEVDEPQQKTTSGCTSAKREHADCNWAEKMGQFCLVCLVSVSFLVLKSETYHDSSEDLEKTYRNSEMSVHRSHQKKKKNSVQVLSAGFCHIARAKPSAYEMIYRTDPSFTVFLSHLVTHTHFLNKAVSGSLP